MVRFIFNANKRNVIYNLRSYLSIFLKVVSEKINVSNGPWHLHKITYIYLVPTMYQEQFSFCGRPQVTLRQNAYIKKQLFTLTPNPSLAHTWKLDKWVGNSFQAKKTVYYLGK